jgi:hypothetical protein
VTAFSFSCPQFAACKKSLRAMKVDPGSSEPLYMAKLQCMMSACQLKLAACLIQTGNFNEAVAECEAVLAQDSDSVRVGKAFYSRGVAHRGWAHRERAMEKTNAGSASMDHGALSTMSLQLLNMANLDMASSLSMLGPDSIVLKAQRVILEELKAYEREAMEYAVPKSGSSSPASTSEKKKYMRDPGQEDSASHQSIEPTTTSIEENGVNMMARTTHTHTSKLRKPRMSLHTAGANRAGVLRGRSHSRDVSPLTPLINGLGDSISSSSSMSPEAASSAESTRSFVAQSPIGNSRYANSMSTRQKYKFTYFGQSHGLGDAATISPSSSQKSLGETRVSDAWNSDRSIKSRMSHQSSFHVENSAHICSTPSSPSRSRETPSAERGALDGVRQMLRAGTGRLNDGSKNLRAGVRENLGADIRNANGGNFRAGVETGRRHNLRASVRGNLSLGDGAGRGTLSGDVKCLGSDRQAQDAHKESLSLGFGIGRLEARMENNSAGKGDIDPIIEEMRDSARKQQNTHTTGNPKSDKESPKDYDSLLTRLIEEIRVSDIQHLSANASDPRACKEGTSACDSLLTRLMDEFGNSAHAKNEESCESEDTADECIERHKITKYQASLNSGTAGHADALHTDDVMHTIDKTDGDAKYPARFKAGKAVVSPILHREGENSIRANNEHNDAFVKNHADPTFEKTAPAEALYERDNVEPASHDVTSHSHEESVCTERATQAQVQAASHKIDAMIKMGNIHGFAHSSSHSNTHNHVDAPDVDGQENKSTCEEKSKEVESEDQGIGLCNAGESGEAKELHSEKLMAVVGVAGNRDEAKELCGTDECNARKHDSGAATADVWKPSDVLMKEPSCGGAVQARTSDKIQKAIAGVQNWKFIDALKASSCGGAASDDDLENDIVDSAAAIRQPFSYVQRASSNSGRAAQTRTEQGVNFDVGNSLISTPSTKPSSCVNVTGTLRDQHFSGLDKDKNSSGGTPQKPVHGDVSEVSAGPQMHSLDEVKKCLTGSLQESMYANLIESSSSDQAIHVLSEDENKPSVTAQQTSFVERTGVSRGPQVKVRKEDKQSLTGTAPLPLHADVTEAPRGQHLQVLGEDKQSLADTAPLPLRVDVAETPRIQHVQIDHLSETRTSNMHMDNLAAGVSQLLKARQMDSTVPLRRETPHVVNMDESAAGPAKLLNELQLESLSAPATTPHYLHIPQSGAGEMKPSRDPHIKMSNMTNNMHTEGSTTSASAQELFRAKIMSYHAGIMSHIGEWDATAALGNLWSYHRGHMPVRLLLEEFLMTCVEGVRTYIYTHIYDELYGFCA